jgi:hypothetical protein
LWPEGEPEWGKTTERRNLLRNCPDCVHSLTHASC